MPATLFVIVFVGIFVLGLVGNVRRRRGTDIPPVVYSTYPAVTQTSQ